MKSKALKTALFVGLLCLSTEARAEGFPKGTILTDQPAPSHAEYTQMANTVMGNYLADPYSAVIEPGVPYQVTCKPGVLRLKGKTRWRGWGLDIRVNAKNAFGAYVGNQTFTALIGSDGPYTYYQLISPQTFGAYNLCKRETWTASASTEVAASAPAPSTKSKLANN